MNTGRLINLLLCLASCSLIVLTLEVSLRLIGYDTLRPFQNGRELIVQLSEHPLLKYEHIPTASGWAWNTDVAINSRGFRGPEPAQGTFSGSRVLVLGDSIGFGIKLDVEATFARQLQKLLDPDILEFEVLNLSVAGYDTLQEVAFLEYTGLQYRPQLVVVAYCLNDLGTVSTNVAFSEKLRTRTDNPLFKSRAIQFVTEMLDRNSQTKWLEHKNDPAVFRQEYRRQIEKISDEETELLVLMDATAEDRPSPWYSERDRVGRLRFAFQWLRKLSERNDFSVLVLIIPWLVEDDGSYPHATAHRIVELEARRANFATMDFTEQFRAAGIVELRISRGDPIHPNRAGHAIIAEQLSKYVRVELKKRSHNL